SKVLVIAPAATSSYDDLAVA
nr:complement C3 72 kda subunit {N-terminal} [hagfish, serum, Peptide Partial, 20 aa] [Eptatretus burgeri]AAA82487.1 complement C3b 72 kda subunit {N-terminal} [hagfish, serum, Peptide Partial, 20 aa] [Eptatretus burgeri]